MSSAISSATAAWPSLFGSTCGAASSSSSGASGLAQAEQQLFAAIDTNGNGSISQNELTHFMSALSGSASPTPSSAASTLFGALATNGSGSSASSSSSGGISLQDFQSNISTFLTALRSQLAAATATGGANAGATASASSAAASGTPGSAHGMHHGHQGHGGADALLASLMQQLSTSPVQSSGLAGVSLSTLA